MAQPGAYIVHRAPRATVQGDAIRTYCGKIMRGTEIVDRAATWQRWCLMCERCST